MLSRRKFLERGLIAGTGLYVSPYKFFDAKKEGIIMTVNGPIRPADMKFTLEHEHILVDFIGAEKFSPDRYQADEVFSTALPFLKDVKNRGCTTFIECTPVFLGRDARLLKRLAKASGLHILTNTGYYGAQHEKFLPKNVYTETSSEIAARWTGEWKNGIEGSGIKPGFIKTSVDKAPLSPAQEKIIEAAALAHLDTGLTIAIHTGDGKAAQEQLRILSRNNVSPQARIWVHAQNEPDKSFHLEAARQKSWVSFDGLNPETISLHVEYLQNMKSEKLLDQVLVSQDSGWYHVGEPHGGIFNNYDTLFTQFIPALKQNSFTQEEIDTLFIVNPSKAFTVSVRKLN
jgi:predicted metal-dependent phosphotriesterase family hydrolase